MKWQVTVVESPTTTPVPLMTSPPLTRPTVAPLRKFVPLSVADRSWLLLVPEAGLMPVTVGAG